MLHQEVYYMSKTFLMDITIPDKLIEQFEALTPAQQQLYIAQEVIVTFGPIVNNANQTDLNVIQNNITPIKKKVLS